MEMIVYLTTETTFFGLNNHLIDQFIVDRICQNLTLAISLTEVSLLHSFVR